MKEKPNTIIRLQGQRKNLFKLQPKSKDHTNSNDYLHVI